MYALFIPVLFNSTSFALIFLFNWQHSGKLLFFFFNFKVKKNSFSTKMANNLLNFPNSTDYVDNGPDTHHFIFIYTNFWTNWIKQKRRTYYQLHDDFFHNFNHFFIRKKFNFFNILHEKIYFQVVLVNLVKKLKYFLIFFGSLFLIFLIIVFTPLGFPYSGNPDSPAAQRHWILVMSEIFFYN